MELGNQNNSMEFHETLRACNRIESSMEFPYELQCIKIDKIKVAWPFGNFQENNS